MALNIEGRLECLNILGLGEEAKEDDIKRTYKKLALENHPDKNPHNPDATSRFQKLSRAYYDLTSKYAKNPQCYCPGCGSLHGDYGGYFEDDDDSCDGFYDEDDEYWMHEFKRLFMTVFSESVFKRRFLSKKQKRSYVYTAADKEEDCDFDFLYTVSEQVTIECMLVTPAAQTTSIQKFIHKDPLP
ncbi:hypothetical protein ScPMuIL_014526 [Solemya velum]